MGIKSTYRLTRDQAIQMFIDFKFETKRRKWEAQAVAMTDKELEDILEKQNDARYTDSTGYNNYLIVNREDLDDF